MLDIIDIQAMNEGVAIKEHRDFTIKPSSRDDNKIRSKNNFLRNEQPCCKESRKKRKPRNSRQVNLQSMNIELRLKNPELYKLYR